MKYLKPKEWLLPLLIVAFAALSVTFMQPIFTLKTRWAVLVGVSLIFGLKGKLFPLPNGSTGTFCLLHIGWALATTFWSEMPLLTFLKSGALAAVVLTAWAAAREWVRQHPLSASLDYIIPLSAITFLAAVLGEYSQHAEIDSGPTTMYQGMVSGPNMFGALIAMCSPLVAWKLHQNWRRPRNRYLWLTCAVVFATFLILSRSRGAALLACCVATGLVIAIRPKKRDIAVILAGLTLTSMLVFRAGTLQSYIFKNATTTQGVFHTRYDVWHESYRLAKQGGLLGGGFGVTIGQTSGYMGGFTALGYGREKGNTQLAITEELGFVGLVLYILFIWSLAKEMAAGVKRTRGDARALVGICAGALVGLTLHGIFEAWWVAPGSAITVFFWCFAWISIALVRDRRIIEMTSQARTSTAALGQRQRVPSATAVRLTAHE